MNEPEHVIRQHADFQLAGTQEVVKPLETRPRVLAEGFRARLAPLAAHGRLGELGDVHVCAGKLGVADDSDWALDGFQRFASDFEDGGGEVAGNAVVALGVGEPLVEERRVEGVAAGGVALDQAALVPIDKNT